MLAPHYPFHRLKVLWRLGGSAEQHNTEVVAWHCSPCRILAMQSAVFNRVETLDVTLEQLSQPFRAFVNFKVEFTAIVCVLL